MNVAFNMNHCDFVVEFNFLYIKAYNEIFWVSMFSIFQIAYDDWFFNLLNDWIK